VSKRRLSTAVTRYLLNPLVKPAIRLRIVRGWSILETRGRKTGEPRQTPVGNGLIGDRFWIVAEHGTKAGYVRNIRADPRVRVFVDGRWRTGVATLMPEDDPIERQRSLPKLNARMVRLVGTDLLTIRIDLDDHEAAG
jgi:deazaflavin-dependent oxidoreductase (nitroreductase family)